MSPDGTAWHRMGRDGVKGFSFTSRQVAAPFVFHRERRAMSVSYVPLSKLLPTVSRATRYRWRKAGKIRKPDLVINGREFYLEERPLDQSANDAGDTQDQAKPGTA